MAQNQLVASGNLLLDKPDEHILEYAEGGASPDGLELLENFK
jgi:hypothetical protein